MHNKGFVWMLVICLALGGLTAAAEEAQTPWTYQVPVKELQTGFLILNNMENLLDETFEPQEEMVRLQVRCTSSSAVLLCKTASKALTGLFAAAQRDGVELYANAGYRPFKTQKSMYNNHLERHNGVDDGTVAYPGACDNQTGLGVDVVGKDWIGKQLDESFGQTPEGLWLAENCHQFGFIIRYPADKTELTLDSYQPWHLRYVGKETAAYMQEKNYCLEEFTPEWQKALEDFLSAGGDIQAAIEAARLPEGEIILEDETGPDGDYEVSLYRE